MLAVDAEVLGDVVLLGEGHEVVVHDLGGILDALLGLERGAGNLHAAVAQLAGAAHGALRLKQDDAQALVDGFDGARKAGGASAHCHDVSLVVPRLGHGGAGGGGKAGERGGASSQSGTLNEITAIEHDVPLSEQHVP